MVNSSKNRRNNICLFIQVNFLYISGRGLTVVKENGKQQSDDEATAESSHSDDSQVNHYNHPHTSLNCFEKHPGRKEAKTQLFLHRA